MYYLGYLSSATFFDHAVVQKILHESRANNLRLDVTGMLLMIDNTFLQILEGDRPVVQELYRKISLDDRHKDVIRILEGDKDERDFEQWSMGFKSLSLDESINIHRFLDLSARNFRINSKIRIILF
jgi:hypothetical protein